MITNHLHYAQEISRAIKRKPEAIYVSSYNLNTGVSSRGTTYPTPTFAAFSEINKTVPLTFVLIGPPPGRSDFKGCITNAQQQWPNVQFRTLDGLHLKCWIFRYKKHTAALIGGRNLGDSQWFDASWWLNGTDSRALLKYYRELWDKGSAVNVVKTENMEIFVGNKRVI